MLVDRLDKSRFSIRRQPHQFVFARIDTESAVGRERRVKQSQGMREAQLLEQFQALVPPLSDGRGRVLAYTIDGQNSSLVKRRGVERAGGVGLVVLSEQDLARFRQPG